MKMRKLAALLLAGCLIIGNAGIVMATETENGTSEQNQEVVSGEQDETETPGENSEDLSNATEETDKETEGQQTDEVDKETDEQQDVEKDTAGENGISVQSKTGVETQVAEANTLDVVYVSATGDDENGTGTQEKPLATLAEAVDVAKDGATVYVMSDLDASSLVFIDHKSVTIDGGGNTVTRVKGFAPKNDVRGGYNPAMIEVANGSTLTLKNITLNDAFLREADIFLEQPTSGDNKNNESKAQDAIIAAYNGGGTIILGDGTTLKNFGGMSAVRVGGQGQDASSTSKLVMQAGSQIIDDSLGKRAGGAAAVWSQGGIVEVQSGAKIAGIDGRAMYLEDGAYAQVTGSIENITANAVMANTPDKTTDLGGGAMNGGFAGIAVAAWGNSTFVLGDDSGQQLGIISNIKSNDGTSADVATFLSGSTFSMKEGSVFSDIETIGLMDDNGGHVFINGTVRNCHTEKVLFRVRGGANYGGDFTLQEKGAITDSSTTDAGIIYVQHGTPNITIEGTISDCQLSSFLASGAIFMTQNGIQNGTCTIAKTGKIQNLTGLGGYGITVDGPSKLYVEGEISGCSRHAIRYKGYRDSLVEINGGTIGDNNGGSAQVQVTYASQISATEAVQHVKVANGVLKGNTTIDLPPFDVTLDADYSDIQLGQASNTAAQAIMNGVAAVHDDWTVIGSSAVWMQPSEESVHFTASKSSSVKNTGLFAAYVPLDENGEPNGDVELKEVGNEDVIDVTLDGLTPGQSYALMFVNNTEYTLTPDDVTIYTGGGQEDETYDNGGFPILTISDSVDLEGEDLESLTVNGEDRKADDASLLDQLVSLLEVTYTDEDGNEITDDSEPGAYTATLTLKEGYEPEDIRVNGNEINIDGEGELIVRHTSNTDGATKGTITYKLLTKEPTQQVDHAEAIAKKSLWGSDPEFYLNDDDGHSFENTGGVQLLDDDLLTDFGDGRQELLEEKAAEYLGAPGEGQAYRYDFHYLDLVDAYNGNAWVSAEYGTTVYLPYPEGVTKETAEDLGVKVIHYKDLHREYGISGQAEVEEAIEACELETMTVTFTDAGIKFDTEKAGFSPFAVVWQTEAHTITASAGEGGTISPSGSVIVGEGADKSFIMTPNEGYDIAEIKIDGQAVKLADIVDEDGIAAYTFENITADHTIEVTFKAEPTTPGGGDEPDEPDDPDVPDEPDVPGGNDKPDKPGSGQDNTGVKDTNAGKDNAGQDRAVKTGDTTDIMLYVMLTGAALCAVAGTLTWRKIRK